MTTMAISTLTSMAALPLTTTAGASTATATAAPTGTSAGSATDTSTSASFAAPSPSTSVTLSELSAEAGIVATLNGGSTVQTYDATGLLNLVAQAGTAGKTATAASQHAMGGTSVASTVSADWGTILKSNPGLTPTAVGYAVTQDIVNTLSTYA